jgi:dTDP-4-amino-4,6-dideoxygalactose transaminase
MCALGISQIARLEQFKQSRRHVFEQYALRISECEWINTPTEREYVDTNWHLYPVRVSPEIRKRLFVELRKEGIGVQVNYIPAYRHPVFGMRKEEYSNFPSSENFYNSEISLPMHSDLSEEQLDRITDVIRKFIP